MFVVNGRLRNNLESIVRWTHTAYLSDNRRRAEEGNAFVFEKKTWKSRKEGRRPDDKASPKRPGTPPCVFPC
ncbi:hypothetical protein CEXT_127961 [Caerostris extrusa]|uniref:Uncharacterized protein n=1 Tax=Caerostris extrusa TaxID=172846 RepID=A0AAV4ST97_CAEEX|nr:hypothetical protein CEXT_127961 [Caerostris extrusa]